MALTERRIARLPAGRHKDVGGLYINVTSTGRRSWILRASVEGRRVDKGLGSYPAVSLQEARLLAQETIFQIRVNGLAPAPKPKVVTFREATRRAHAAFKDDWRPGHAAEWLRGLELHTFDALGDIPVADVTQEQVLDVLMPLYEAHPVSARKTRARIRRVFGWCIARGLRRDNPAGEVLDGGLPRKLPKSRHLAAPHYADVAASIARIRTGSTNLTTRMAFETVAHTAARYGEVRGMRWAELDDAWTTWTLPAERSKDGREHRKPITRQVRSILRAAKGIQAFQGRAHDLVFCARSGRPVGRGTLAMLLSRYGMGHTVHGLRSSFRVWGAEHGKRWDALEIQLSHTVGNAVSQAYNRTDLLEERSVLMQEWSDYLDAEDYWRDPMARLIVPIAAGG